MQYRALIAVLLVAGACGDDGQSLQPDAAVPDAAPDAGPDAPPATTCATPPDPAKLATGTWDDQFTVAGFTGFDGHAPTVYDFARDSDGSIVAAGEFQYLGKDRVEPLLRYRNGAWEPARTTWELTPPGSGFAAVAIDPAGRLALATYDDFGPRDGEVWIDDGTGLRKIGAFTGLVRRLAWHDGDLWLAGTASVMTPTTTITNVAVWNGTSWTPPPGGAADGPAYALEEASDGMFYVGGAFTHIGGIAAKGVASRDTTWHALNFPNVSVYAIAVNTGGTVYAGGTFGQAFDEHMGGVARWNGTTWELAGGGLANHGIVGVVTDLTNSEDGIVATGCFATAGAPDGDPAAIPARDVAVFKGTWHALDDGTRGTLGPWIEPLYCGDEGPDAVWNVSKQRVFNQGQRLLFGGSFAGIGGVQSQGVISYADEWHAETPSGNGIAGNLDRIATSDDCDTWGFGRFTHVGGMATTAQLVHWTGTAWEAIPDDLPADSYCPAFAVSTAGNVVVGCIVFHEDSDATGALYHLDGGRLVDTGIAVPPVQALSWTQGGTLWIGGGSSTGFVGKLTNDGFVMVTDDFDQPVALLDGVTGDDVIAGGGFTKQGTTPVSRIARYSGGAWHALGAGLPGDATAIAHDATHVYASSYDFGDGAYLLGAFDGTAWTELATPAAGLTPVSDFNFNAIRVVGDAVLAAGTADLDDASGRGLLVYRNGHFTALGGGVHASLLSGLAVTSHEVWVAGSIAEVGAGETQRSSVGVARFKL